MHCVRVSACVVRATGPTTRQEDVRTTCSDDRCFDKTERARVRGVCADGEW